MPLAFKVILGAQVLNILAIVLVFLLGFQGWQETWALSVQP